MTEDIILITVDCWRDDTVEDMPQLQSLTEDFSRGSAICQAPATRGAFPALLAGQYYPQAYADYDTLKPTVEPLPELLAEEGYTTGAVVGSNPFLTAWEDSFEYFWNDEMDFGTGSDGEGWVGGQLSTLRDALSFASVRSRVPARRVAERAQSWYREQSGPRFLWVHLMDIHVPFLPGFRRGVSEGLLSTYRTHLRFMRDPQGLQESEYDQLERLYRASVSHMDEQLDAIFDIDPDAEKVLVGDHGEEFDHDKFGHARLYEECVRVPLLASPGLAPHLGGGETVRQIDVPAGILSAVGREPPSSWAVSESTERWPAFMLNHSPQFERVYAGIRTRRYKLLKTFQESMGPPERIELYDLETDPAERTNRYPTSPESDRLEAQLDAFLSRPDIESGLLERTHEQSAAVEERLKALGYR